MSLSTEFQNFTHAIVTKLEALALANQNLDQIITDLKSSVGTEYDNLKKIGDAIDLIKTLLGSNDVNLDSIQEIVNYIKSNKTLIDSITIDKANANDVYTKLQVDNLISASQYTLPVASASVLGGVKQGSNVTIDANGVISASNSYIHPSGDGNLHVPATSTTNNGKFLKAGSTAGSISWNTLSATDIPNLDASKITTGTLTVATSGNAGTATKLQTARTIALTGDATATATSFDGSANISLTTTIATATTTTKGLLSSADKTKLDSLSNYTHPANHPASIITQDANNRFVSDTQISGWDAKASLANITTAINDLKGGVGSTYDTLNKLATEIVNIKTTLGSDDINLDTVQEIVAYIKANKSLIDSITTNKADKTSVYLKTEIDTLLNSKAGTTTATTTTDGLLSSADKTKLDGIATNANNYTLPVASASALGGVKIGTGITVAGDGTISASAGSSLVGATLGTSGGTSGSTLLGVDAGKVNTAKNNVFIGFGAGQANTTGGYNVANGNSALYSNTTGGYNVANGSVALYRNTMGLYNVANGYYAMFSNTTGGYNVANGNSALYSNTTGCYNVANGSGALYSNTTGDSNVANGYYALYQYKPNATTPVYISLTNARNSATKDSGNTALGAWAGYNNLEYVNTTSIGYNAQVSGDNQLQLGDIYTNVYAQNALNVRSDARDKTDIQPLDIRLGLEFIKSLRPVEYRMDERSRYVDYKEVKTTVKDENGNEREEITYEKIELAKDGSRKGNRLQQGLIAQEVKSVMDSLGVDFSGYQDHKVKGGDDVLTLSYEKLIPSLILAIQQQQKQIDELKARLG